MGNPLKRIWDAIERGRRFVAHDIWHIGLPGEEIPNGFIIKQARILVLLFHGIAEETILLRASALTFATMLFIVPFLTLLFFFIQTFNLGDQFYSEMSHKMEDGISAAVDLFGMDNSKDLAGPPLPMDAAPPPLVETEGNSSALAAANTAATPPETTPQETRERQNEALRQRIIAAIFPVFSAESDLNDNNYGSNPVKLLVEIAEQGATNPQALTITGLFFVLSTVFGFMRNVESSFNRIWGVRRTRNLFRAVSDYMMITILLPFALAAVLGITAALESAYVVSKLGQLSIMLRGGQFMVICTVFFLLYYFVPNTKVNILYALFAGIVAAALWMLVSWGYVKFQFGLVRYLRFFSGFALFPLFFMWIYCSWLILLFGALLTYACQHEKTFAMERLAKGASFAYREALAIRAMLEMSARFRCGEPGLDIVATAREWNVPTRLLNETLESLIAAKMAAACATEPVTYQPARATDTIRILDVARAIREEGFDPSKLREEEHFQAVYAGIGEGDKELLETSVDTLAQRLGG